MKVGSKLALIVVAGIAIGAISTTVAAYYYSLHKTLETQSNFLLQATEALNNSNEITIAETELGLEALSGTLSRALSEPAINGEEVAFNALVERNPDQAWRSVRNNYDGKQDAGIFLPPEAKLDAEQKRLHLRSKRILEIFGSAIGSPNGNVWLLTHEKTEVIYDKRFNDFVFQMPVDQDYTKTPWLTLGDPANNPERMARWTAPLYDEPSKTWIISVIVPVDVSGRWVGNLGRDFSLSSALPSMASVEKKYEDEHQFLLNAQGHFIKAGPWQKLLETSDGGFKRAISKESDLMQLIEHARSVGQPYMYPRQVKVKGSNYMAVVTPIKHLGWQYFRLVPVDRYIVPLKHLFFGLVFIVMAFCCLMGLVINKVAKHYVVKRLQLLSDAVSKYGQGELNARVGLAGDDEIAATSRAFDVMVERVRVREREISLIVNNMPGAVSRVDRNMRYVYASDQYAVAFGKPIHQIVGSTMPEILGEKLFNYEKPYIERALTGERVNFEIQGQLATGEYRFGLVHFIPDFDQNVEIDGFIIIVVDITEMRLAEAAKMEANNRLYKIATRLPGLVYQFRLRPDGSTCFPFASEAITRIFQLSEEEVREDASKAFAMIHPDDLEDVMTSIQVSAKDLTPWREEFRMLFKDGAEHWISGNSIPELESDGSVLWHGFINDITDQKQIEQHVKETEQRWKFAIEGTGDGVWDVNVQTQEANYSKRWKEMLGFTEEEVLTNRLEWISRIHPDDKANVLNSGQTYLDGLSDSYVVEYRLRCRDESYKWMLSRGMIVSRDVEGKPLRMIGTQTDITQRKQAELRIKRLSNLYEVLSKCNLSIVHCTSREELFTQICHDSVIFGGLKMAWIGLIDVPTKQVKLAAEYGDDVGYLNDINISVDADSPFSQGPVGTSIRENTPYWCQDYINDPRTLNWRERGIAAGWTSSASLPLYCNGDVIGAFSIYSNEKDTFDEEIRNLLVDMATNISFALDNFDREANRLLAQSKLTQAQNELAQSHDRFKDLYEFAPIGYLTISKHGLITQLNWRASAMLGLDRKNIINQRITQFIDEEEKPRWARLFHNIVGLEASEELSFDMKFTLHNGVSFYANLNCMRMNDEDEQSMLRVTLEDVTTVKNSEIDLRIAATAFESQDGLMITDAENRILRVNKAFTDITGYTDAELVGKNPSMLSSGRHDATFFDAMWESINKTGRWSGEVWNRRKSGDVYPENLTISTVKNDLGVITNYVGANTDISQMKAATEEIQQLAFFDSLTHLPNRRLLLDRLKHALAACARSGRQGAVLFLDLDHFKVLNDSLGHDIGDLLLQQVATRLTTCVREGDTVARLGGDEYVVVLEDLSDQGFEAAAQTEIIVNKILAALNQPYELNIHEHHITPSIGITVFDGHSATIEELLKQADIAMYQAKKAGRNTMRFFNPQMQTSITARVAIERELRKALENKQLHLYYQIQVDNLGTPLGAEALIRWIHPERGVVSPAQFVPLAEETGLILPIGNWVLDTACAQIKAWHDSPHTRDLTLSINVSAKQFRQADFVAQVRAAIEKYSIDPMQLKLELTESLLLDNIEDTIVSMTALGEIGVQFSLDDFGTGYSSLQYLKRLPLFQLKIDQSFVRDIVTDSHDRSIVRTIIAMAQSLYLNVIAEGVETEEQRTLLLSNGCKRYQGYLFSKPVPIEQFEAMLKQVASKIPSKANLEHI